MPAIIPMPRTSAPTPAPAGNSPTPGQPTSLIQKAENIGKSALTGLRAGSSDILQSIDKLPSWINPFSSKTTAKIVSKINPRLGSQMMTNLTKAQQDTLTKSAQEISQSPNPEVASTVRSITKSLPITLATAIAPEVTGATEGLGMLLGDTLGPGLIKAGVAEGVASKLINTIASTLSMGASGSVLGGVQASLKPKAKMIDVIKGAASQGSGFAAFGLTTPLPTILQPIVNAGLGYIATKLAGGDKTQAEVNAAAGLFFGMIAHVTSVMGGMKAETGKTDTSATSDTTQTNPADQTQPTTTPPAEASPASDTNKPGAPTSTPVMAEAAAKIPESSTITDTSPPESGINKVEGGIKGVIDKVVKAIKDAKPFRAAQESSYTQERAARLAKGTAAEEAAGGGTAGFKAKLSLLSGEMSKVKAHFETLTNSVTPEEISSLTEHIRQNKELSDWEKITAQNALENKLFGKDGGIIPTNGEIDLLNRVFGDKFTEAIQGKQSFATKALRVAGEIANIPRSLQTLIHFTAPLKQALLGISRPEWWGNLPTMFKAFGSDKFDQAVNESIVNDPHYETFREASTRLELTKVGGDTAHREEDLMSTLTNKIPWLGEIFKSGSRGYTAFLNKFAFDTASNMYDAIKLPDGETPTDKQVSDISKFINNLRGRGSIPTWLEGAEPLINAGFYSPKLFMGTMETLNPMQYVGMDPAVRLQAVKTVIGSGVILTSVLAAFKGLSTKDDNINVETDTTSSDFGKVTVGDTRYNLLGSYGPILTFGARFILNKSKSSTTGVTAPFGPGFDQQNRLTLIENFLQSKESPIYSFVTDLLTGKDYQNQPVTVKAEAANLFIPFFAQAIMQIINDNPDQGIGQLLLESIPTFFVGTNTYPPATPKQIKSALTRNKAFATEARKRSLMNQ